MKITYECEDAHSRANIPHLDGFVAWARHQIRSDTLAFLDLQEQQKMTWLKTKHCVYAGVIRANHWARGFGNNWFGGLWSPRQTLDYMFVFTQLCLALGCGDNPHAHRLHEQHRDITGRLSSACKEGEECLKEEKGVEYLVVARTGKESAIVIHTNHPHPVSMTSESFHAITTRTQTWE